MAEKAGSDDPGGDGPPPRRLEPAGSAAEETPEHVLVSWIKNTGADYIRERLIVEGARHQSHKWVALTSAAAGALVVLLVLLQVPAWAVVVIFGVLLIYVANAGVHRRT